MVCHAVVIASIENDAFDQFALTVYQTCVPLMRICNEAYVEFQTVTVQVTLYVHPLTGVHEHIIAYVVLLKPVFANELAV